MAFRPEETPAAPATDAQIADGEIQSNWDEIHDNFDNMNLNPELLRGVFAYGYVSCAYPVSNAPRPFSRAPLCP